MEEKQLSEQDSFLLIQQMISTAKKEQVDDGKRWIVWGWMLFAASFFSVLNLELNWNLDQYIFWNAFGVIALVFLLYNAFNFFFGNKGKAVVTYTKDLHNKLNIGFIISLMLIIFSMNIGIPGYSVPPVKGFALLLGLYGFWILIYGTTLNFKPSIIGAYITWAFAFVCLFVKVFEWTMILHAAAVLCGYVIPGYLANKEFKKINRPDKVIQSV